MVKQEAPHHGVWYVQSFNLHVNPFVLFAVINIYVGYLFVGAG
jgi:hypothetical protein